MFAAKARRAGLVSQGYDRAHTSSDSMVVLDPSIDEISFVDTWFCTP